MFQDTGYLQSYEGKTVLVTGAGGYVGSSLIKALSPAACTIIGLVREPNKMKDLPKSKASIYICQGDIRDKKIWEDALEKVDIIFHFAAQTSSRSSNDNLIEDLEINLLPVVNIIETCIKHKYSPTIIFAGTVTEVGLTENLPVNETYRDSPITVYDINKLSAEKYLQFYSSHLGNKAVTLRLSNVYGPGVFPSRSDRGILNKMIKRALRGEPLTIYGEGCFVRDYVYIDDVVKAFLIAGEKIDVLKGSYYIIGSGRGYTIKDAFELISRITEEKIGKKPEILSVPYPDNLSQIEYRNFVADTTRFSTLTGWEADVSLPEGINRTADYFLKERL